MTKEDRFSKKITNSLEKLRIEKKLINVKIENKKQILIGITAGVFNEKLKLLFQSAEQDIVIYLDSKNCELIFSESNYLSRYTRSIPDNKILIPLLIFEVKQNSVITHSVRHYSEIAQMIKSVFPFCMYNLLLLNFKNPKETNIDKVYMASKNFDKIIYFDKNDSKNHKLVVENLWKIIKQHIDYLKRDSFFRLNKYL